MQVTRSRKCKWQWLRRVYQWKSSDSAKICISFSAFALLPLLGSIVILVFCDWSTYTHARATTTAEATITPQNNRFNERKQSLCTCVLCFCTFLCRPLQNDNVKWPNSWFCRRTWTHDGEFFNSPSLLERRSYQFSSRILRPHCTSSTNWNNRKVVEVTFSLPLLSSLPSTWVRAHIFICIRLQITNSTVLAFWEKTIIYNIQRFIYQLQLIYLKASRSLCIFINYAILCLDYKWSHTSLSTSSLRSLEYCPRVICSPSYRLCLTSRHIRRLSTACSAIPEKGKRLLDYSLPMLHLIILKTFLYIISVLI